MSRFQFSADDPGSIEFTLTATLTLDQWCQVQAVLTPKHYGPTGWLDKAINDMVTRAKSDYKYHASEGNPAGE